MLFTIKINVEFKILPTPIPPLIKTPSSLPFSTPIPTLPSKKAKKIKNNTEICRKCKLDRPLPLLSEHEVGGGGGGGVGGNGDGGDGDDGGDDGVGGRSGSDVGDNDDVGETRGGRRL